jgi:hydrophobe/amphiphile efflux-1 (HAE1) family protein
MTLPRLSISRPVFAWMLTAAIFLFGGLAFSRLGISLLPDVDYPFVSVSVNYPGASPELVESDITEVFEGALSGVEGVRRMSSSSRYGSSRVSLEFDIDKDINFALQEVQSAAQIAFRLLPDGVEAPTVRKTNPEDQPIMWIALSGNVSKRELMLFARNSVKDRFTAIEGVSDVTLGGYIDPAVRIWVDPVKLERLELTHEDIIATLRSEHVELPAGRITREKDEISLRFQGEAPDIKTLQNIPITRRSGQPLYRTIPLSSVARVEAGLEDVRRFARSGGKEAIGLGMIKQRGSNSVAVADRVIETMETLSLPEGYELSINFDTTQSIRRSINELIFTLCLSVALTAFVCWLFLGSLVSTLNIVIAIPTSLLGTFLAFSWLGYTLNNFTMLALILGVGIIVDDAIMVLENIFRWRGIEKNTQTAALKGAEQVVAPAVATTLAVIAIFIPIIYVSGIIGAYLTQFAIALSIAVAFSTFEALTFTPMRLANFKGSGAMRGLPRIFDGWIQKSAQIFANLITRLYGHPFKIYAILLVVAVGSFAVVRTVPTEMNPDEDQGSLIARAELPLGTSLDETGHRLEAVESVLLEHPEIRRVYTIVGGFGGGTVNTAVMFVTLTDKKTRTQTHADIMSELRSKLNSIGDGLVVRLQSMGGQGFGRRRGFPIELNLKSSNWESLVATSRQLEAALKEDPFFVDVDSGYEDGAPEFRLIPNRERALARGVSLSTIAETLAFVYQGITPAKFNDDGRRVNIILQAEQDKVPTHPDDFKNLYVRNNRSQLIPLSELIDVRKDSSPIAISRENRERNIEVYANLAQGVTMDRGLTRSEEIFANIRSEDVRLAEGGSRGDFTQTFRDLILALILGIIVAYMVLASQYNSYLDPLLILLALPFSFGGAFIALKLSGSTLNLFSMIGLLLLMGIVKKNSIMLVEFANQEFKAQAASAKNYAHAMTTACRTRFRPILMTAFTTISAALPPALGIGIDSAATSSMSIGIIGGLILSTFLTLVVVPVAYVQVKSGILRRNTIREATPNP